MTKRSSQLGFGIVEQLVVTVMGAIFIMIFVHGTLIVLDRFFSVQTVTDFDEERKILRAQVAAWSGSAFSSEVYLSNELLEKFNVKKVTGDPILPYTGSFGSGVALAGHAIIGTSFVVPTVTPEAYDVSFLIIRDPGGNSYTVMDDNSAVPAFPGNPGLYKFNRVDPYVYVDRVPDTLQVDDYVTLSSVAGAGFGRIKLIEGTRITFDFTGLGVFRPADPVMTEGPFVVFYKGGTITPFKIMFVGVNLDDVENPQMLIGQMNRDTSAEALVRMHSLKLPVRSLRLIRGSVTTIPGGTFVPFQTPQQLAASLVVPSFLSSRLAGRGSQNSFDQEVTFLVPL